MFKPVHVMYVLASAWAVTSGFAADGPVVETDPVSLLEENQTANDLRTYLLRHTPLFVPPSDGEEWLERSEVLRQRVLDEVVLRGIPRDWFDREPNIVWGEELAGQGYVIRKLRYEVVPGTWAGGLLYEPMGLKGKVPVILNPNGHVGEPGMTIDYKQARCINLARRGMLALNLEWIGMGQLRDGFSHNDLSYLDLCGRSGLGVFYLALKRGLDVLCSHEAADPNRVAVTGLSGGGWQTILISALDTRVQLAVPNAGFIGMHSRIWNARDIGDREQNATDLVANADYVTLTAMLAPRPALLIYNEKDDCCFVSERAWYSVYQPVKPVYDLLGAGDLFAFHVNHDPGTHNYDLDNRQAFYRFLNRHFLPAAERRDDEIPVAEEIRKPEELRIDYPAENAGFRTLALRCLPSLPRRKVPASDPDAVEIWRREARQLLRSVVRPDTLNGNETRTVQLSASLRDVHRLPSRVWRLRVGGTWTLPLAEYVPGDGEPKATCLILADEGRAGAGELVAEVLSRGERAVVADILFTGECMGPPGQAWKLAQMISTVGRRVLGIQSAQVAAVLDHLCRRFPEQPLRMATKGRVAGLAGLVSAALRPGFVSELSMNDMCRSLKDLVVQQISYSQSPSLYCFGLLEAVDIPELVELAGPTAVSLAVNRITSPAE